MYARRGSYLHNTTNMRHEPHALNDVWTQNPGNVAAADLGLRSHSHWNPCFV